MARLDKVLGADFETDHDGEKAWMVQWAISDGQSEDYGTEWGLFEETLVSHMRKGETFLYFHNLKYDLEFMKYSLRRICEEYGFEMLIGMRDKNPLFIQIDPGKGSRFKKLHIRDSLKKVPGTLDQLAKLVGMRKLEGFDFEAGWSKTVNLDDDSNWDYIRNDARIVAIAMQQMHDLGNRKSTFSGDAWAECKRHFAGGRYFPVDYKWEDVFPQLPIELDLKLRLGYFGGINISQHKGINRGKLLHADVNSMYPAVMYYDPLPYGHPTYTKEIPSEDSLFVIKGWFKLNLKPGRSPWFIFKNGFDNIIENIEHGTPVVKTEQWHEMTLTSVDLELMIDWYNIEIHPDMEPEFWVFKSAVGLHKDYIDHYIKIKETAGKGTLKREDAKLHMNAVYGRSGLNPHGQETTLEEIDGELKWVATKILNEDNDAYLPYAMFVTAHARRRLLEYVEKCGCENVIHCDTDSVIHYGGQVEGIKYGKGLGEWSIECEPLAVYEGGFKRYVEILREDRIWTEKEKWLNMACAGVPKKTNVNGIPVGMWVEILDNPEVILSDKHLGQTDYKIESDWLRELYIKNGMNPDCVNTMKLIPERVPGGIILRERQHKLNDNLRMRLR